MNRLNCTIAETAGADWWEAHRALQGGFFCDPLSVGAVLAEGTPLYFSLRDQASLVGVGVGVARHCRLGSAMHVEMATPPVMTTGMDDGRVLSAVIRALAALGAADLTVQSFDSGRVLPVTGRGRILRERIEYIVPIEPDDAAQTARLSSTHRRHLRKAEKAGWTVRTPTPDEAAALLLLAQESAAARADARGDGFATASLTAGAMQAFRSIDEPGGVALFVAEAGDTLLGAALIGWSTGRAFYLRGGSTPEGYQQRASVWLHTQIMNRLRAHGIRQYNLGGTPADAPDENHAQHGLYRFKTAFGAEIVHCRGGYWPLNRIHLALHRAVAAVRRQPSE